MKILYFTATGNSLYVAKSLSKECYSIPQLIKENNFNIEDKESIGFVFPSYWYNIPNIVKEFLEKVIIKSPYIFVIITAAESSKGAANVFIDICKKRNINVSYMNEVILPSNHVGLSNLNKPFNKYNEAEKQIDLIKKDINDKKVKIEKDKGIIIRTLLKGIFKVFPIDCRGFKVSKKCTNCKTCSKVCPRGNITYKNNKVIFGNNCEDCLACVNLCPEKAIEVKNDKSKGVRYINKHIKLLDLIESNNQNKIS